jgi:hypothetical protein
MVDVQLFRRFSKYSALSEYGVPINALLSHHVFSEKNARLMNTPILRQIQ